MATMIATGTYEGDGTAKDIEIGFIPDYVRVIDVDGAAVNEWFSGMADGTSYTNSTDAASGALNANNGVTPIDDTASTGQGFTAGTDLSTNGNTYYWVAVANGPGF